MTPQNPLPASSTNSKRGGNLKGREGRRFPIDVMVSKGITLLEQMETFNNDIREWRRKSIRLKTWETFGFFSPSTKITMESGKQHRKRGLHHGGVEHLQSTAPPHQKSIMKKMSTSRKSRK